MGLEVTARVEAGRSRLWPGEDGRELDVDGEEECRFEEGVVGMRGEVDTARVWGCRGRVGVSVCEVWTLA
jgi:hypothetical protein